MKTLRRLGVAFSSKTLALTGNYHVREATCITFARLATTHLKRTHQEIAGGQEIMSQDHHGKSDTLLIGCPRSIILSDPFDSAQGRLRERSLS